MQLAEAQKVKKGLTEAFNRLSLGIGAASALRGDCSIVVLCENEMPEAQKNAIKDKADTLLGRPLKTTELRFTVTGPITAL